MDKPIYLGSKCTSNLIIIIIFKFVDETFKIPEGLSIIQ